MQSVMNKTLLLSTCILAMVAASFAASGKEVSYKSGDETVKGILYTPAGSGPFPGVVVIHEWWGLNDGSKNKRPSLPTKDTLR